MVVLVFCKNGKHKNEGTRVVTTLYTKYEDAQGHLTPQSVMGSIRDSNSFRPLRLSLLPARVKIKQ